MYINHIGLIHTYTGINYIGLIHVCTLYWTHTCVLTILDLYMCINYIGLSHTGVLTILDSLLPKHSPSQFLQCMQNISLTTTKVQS